MPSMLSTRRRRYGIFNTRSIIFAVCFCILLLTFFHIHAKPVDPFIDDQRDLKAQDAESQKSRPRVSPTGADTSSPTRETDISKASYTTTQDVLKQEMQRKAFVVASQQTENTTWLEHFFPEWEHFIYHVDDPTAELTVPKNKGRESMVYLT
jgi:hypothetical protein